MKKTVSISRLLLPLVLLCGLTAGLIGGCEYFNLSLEEFAKRQAELAAKKDGGLSDPGENPGEEADLAGPPPGVVLPPSVAPALAKARLWGVDFASLRDALDFANQWALAAGRPEITLLDSITLPETGTAGYTISKNIKLIADSGGKTITRRSAFTDSLFTVASGWSLELRGANSLTLDGNRGSGVTAQAPLITVNGTLRMSSNAVSLQNNNNPGVGDGSVGGIGGGVYVDGGEFVMTGGSITGNEAVAGGGVVVNGGVFSMQAGFITGNKCLKAGGGAYVADSSFTMSGGTISGNTVDTNYGDGGQVFLDGGSFRMTAGIIGGDTFPTAAVINTAHAKDGGGVYVDKGGAFTMTGGEIRNNFAAGNGGGIYMGVNDSNGDGTGTANRISIENTAYIHHNRSYTQGGGIFAKQAATGEIGGFLTMSGGTLADNVASSNPASSISGDYSAGGQVFFTGDTFTMSGGIIGGTALPTHTIYHALSGAGVLIGDSSFIMSGGEIRYNYAIRVGGGIFVDASVNLAEIKGTANIHHNKTNNSGGGLCVYGPVTFSSGTIHENSANADGGGVYVDGNTFTMSGGSITENKANADGGGVYVDAGSLTMSGTSSITGNRANDDGIGSGEGGGVYRNSGTFSQGSGTVSGNTPDDIKP